MNKQKRHIGEPPKRVKNKDAWTWRAVKDAMKTARVGDEIGFMIGKEYWILRRGEIIRIWKNKLRE